MWFTSWPRKKRLASLSKRPTFRPTLEELEHRWVPSTLAVLNNLDSGTGSLRAEITAARSGDTIVFAPSLDGQTITLTSGELLIKKSLTIAGPGAGQVTVSGNNASRVFEVTKTTKSVTLSGLTISNGVVQGVGQLGEGGGILNDGTLTVSNSTLSGNSAGGSKGGGILNDGTLTVSGSTLSGNSARNGGGISNFGTLMVSGSTVSGNSGEGGGIFNFGTLTVSNSALSGNSATHGGGIENASGTLMVIGSTLSGNSADAGGGIYNNGTLTVSGSTLSGNFAASVGGGIYNTNSVSAMVTAKDSSSITGNTAPVGLDVSSIIGILDGNAAVPI